MRRIALTLGLAAVASLSQAQGWNDYFLTGNVWKSVRNFISTDKTFLETLVPQALGGLDDPQAIAVGGPTNDIYIADRTVGAILQFDRLTGAFERTIGAGTLADCRGLAFGADNLLYASDLTSNAVYRFNAETGALVGTFVTANQGGLQQATGITFKAGGHLFVADPAANNVKVYSRVNGAFLRVFTTGGVLNGPQSVAFAPNNTLLVTSPGTGEILRYNGSTGAYIGIAVGRLSGGLGAPRSIAVSPDGKLFVVDQFNNQVLRFDANTGTFIDIFATNGSPAVGAFGLGVRKLQSMTLTHDGGLGGDTLSGFIRLNGPAHPGGTAVSFQSSDTNVATVNPSFSVAEGLNIGFYNFQLKGQAVDKDVTITGTLGRSISVSVTAFRSIINSLTTPSDTVAGGTTVTGTIGMNGTAPSNGAAVIMSSSNTSLATVAPRVTILAGQRSRTFPITTFPVVANSPVTITGLRAGVTVTKTITLTPP